MLFMLCLSKCAQNAGFVNVVHVVHLFRDLHRAYEPIMKPKIMNNIKKTRGSNTFREDYVRNPGFVKVVHVVLPASLKMCSKDRVC